MSIKPASPFKKKQYDMYILARVTKPLSYPGFDLSDHALVLYMIKRAAGGGLEKLYARLKKKSNFNAFKEKFIIL